MRTYTELIKLKTIEERFDYLSLGGRVGEETFGHDRYLNQMLYHSDEWKSVRRDVIMRDNGMDLGVDGFEIFGLITVHHMNPISVQDILERRDIVLDPEYLICVSSATHKAIHYGDMTLLIMPYTQRTPNDMCPWKTVRR